MAEPNTPARWPAFARVPPFLPVPLRVRGDGWVPMRQAQFIGFLAETGSISEAARRVGTSRMAAYRLRRCAEAESFAHAWDAVMAAWQGVTLPRRKVTAGELAEHAFGGPFLILMRRGKFIRAQQKPSTSALLRYLSRMDRAMAGREVWAT